MARITARMPSTAAWSIRTRRDCSICRMPKLVGRHQIANAALAIAALAARRRPLEPRARHRMGLEERRMAGAACNASCAVRWSTPRRRAPRSGSTADTIRIAAPPSRKASPISKTACRARSISSAACSRPRTLSATSCRSAVSARHVTTVAIPGEAASLGAGTLYDAARAAGLDADTVRRSQRCHAAGRGLGARARRRGPPRILICGSLYLAGKVLRENG